MIYAVFEHPKNGYSYEREENEKLGLVVGQAYRLKNINVGSSSSTVYLEEFPKHAFNSVHFEYYEKVNGEMILVDVYHRFYRDHYL